MWIFLFFIAAGLAETISKYPPGKGFGYYGTHIPTIKSLCVKSANMMSKKRKEHGTI